MSAAAEAESFPLPDEAYLPGQTTRPAEDAYDWIRDRTPQRVDADNLGSVESWHYGLRLLREGFFWEAHEVLEPVWMACAPNSREKRFVQAIIQIANAGLKARLDRPNAAARLVEIALDLLAGVGGGSFGGLEPEGIRGRLEAAVADDSLSPALIAGSLANVKQKDALTRRRFR